MEVAYAGEGGGLTADELQAIAEEYAAFGVTYDASIAQWYFHNEPVRDFANLDASGNGTLTGIEKFSHAEFDERTRSSKAVQIREVPTSSGECTVIQQ